MTHPVEHLIVGRHGAYLDAGSDPGLNATGKAQARTMAQLILERTPDLKRTILSSTALRASEFADIMAELLGIDAQKHRCFWDDSSHPGDERECQKLMAACETPVLVVVSHKDLTSGLIGGFTRTQFSKAQWPTELRYGEYWHLQQSGVDPIRLP